MGKGPPPASPSPQSHLTFCRHTSVQIFTHCFIRTCTDDYPATHTCTHTTSWVPFCCEIWAFCSLPVSPAAPVDPLLGTNDKWQPRSFRSVISVSSVRFQVYLRTPQPARHFLQDPLTATQRQLKHKWAIKTSSNLPSVRAETTIRRRWSLLEWLSRHILSTIQRSVNQRKTWCICDNEINPQSQPYYQQPVVFLC